LVKLKQITSTIVEDFDGTTTKHQSNPETPFQHPSELGIMPTSRRCEVRTAISSVVAPLVAVSRARRAWKGFDWGALDRLHQKGLIADPANKAKSVVLSYEGLRRAEKLFHALFTRPAP
jgi:hypothetical protein